MLMVLAPSLITASRTRQRKSGSERLPSSGENSMSSRCLRAKRTDPALDVTIIGAAQAGHRRVFDHPRNRLYRLEIAVRRSREARLDYIHAHAFQLPRDT